MKCKACVFDIDGTLVAKGAPGPSPRTLDALKALSDAGTALIVATGRAPFAARHVLGAWQPDFLVCSTGALVQDKAGKAVYAHTMSPEEMYALVDYCEDHEVPMDFVFDDGYYAYVEYERLKAHALQGTRRFLLDGEDQVRHLQSMPYAACIYALPGQMDGFAAKYGHLGLRLLPFATAGNFYDVLSPGTDKAASVALALARLGLTWADAAAFGDGLNDEEMLAAAGLAVVMGNGEEQLKQPGRIVAPACAEDGVARVIEQYILQ